MPFIPHTEEEVARMLAAIGASGIEELFDEIPKELRFHGLKELPTAMSEMEVTRLMEERAHKDSLPVVVLVPGRLRSYMKTTMKILKT